MTQRGNPVSYIIYHQVSTWRPARDNNKIKNYKTKILNIINLDSYCEEKSYKNK